jgi:hypothetical protein
MDLTRWQRGAKGLRGAAAAALLVVALAGSINPSFSQGPMANGGMPNQGNQGGRQTDPNLIRDWFGKYDQVRRQAQMTPAERSKADDMLSHGLQIFVPGPEKELARNLLTNLVAKYDRACAQLKMMPFYPETGNLHKQYFKYFSEAKALFSDYLRVQGNPMVKDQNGSPVMAGLMTRKQELEATEQQAKAIDQEVRNNCGIPPYRY